MRFVEKLLLGAAALGFSACTSTGTVDMKTLTQDGAEQFIVVGKTTKADITSAMGNAEVNVFVSGDEVWVYRYPFNWRQIAQNIPVAGYIPLLTSDKNVKELKIAFDKDGVVKKFKLIETGEFRVD
jgi:outer membrane protein assembly factor BamE (lipoprotein component of BamABCDE complex)